MPWVSSARWNHLSRISENAIERYWDLKEEYKEAKAEIRRLTDVIIHMRKEGFTLGPEHEDERWPGGSYSMEEWEEKQAKAEPMYSGKTLAQVFAEEELALGAEMQAMIDSDILRVFPDED